MQYPERPWHIQNSGKNRTVGYSESCQRSAIENFLRIVKDSLLGVRQLVTTESFLKMMKKVFYFFLKSLFANNNIRSVILEIKTTDVKSLKY